MLHPCAPPATLGAEWICSAWLSVHPSCPSHTPSPAQQPWLGFAGSRLGSRCGLTLEEQKVRPQFPGVSRDLLLVTSKSCSWSASLLASLGLPGEAVTAGVVGSSCFSSPVFHNPVLHPTAGHLEGVEVWLGPAPCVFWRPSSPCLSHFGLICLCWFIFQQKGGVEAEQNLPGGFCSASSNVGQISMG